ncbi:hypothetical protein RND81_02G156100 [Saponaria officinalis]|uniref:Cupin type-1 domain-containing protein n=1 Tax=Saponaria officinalis TaxID=3572 RepID=A0AAW1MUK7_SAPOF
MVKTTRVIMKSFNCMVLLSLVSLLLAVKNVSGSLSYYEGADRGSVGTAARWVKKEERRPLVATEFGSISSVDIGDGTERNEYHLQMITMEPNSLFLPVLLHSDMVFYVHTGSGRLSWTEGDEMNKVRLQRGDVYRLKSGTLFYIHSNLEPERPRFRIIATFANPDEQHLQGPSIGPYSSINDLVRGFDKPVLQAAFQVPKEVIEEITSTTDTPAIVHADQKSKHKFWEEELLFINALFGTQRFSNQAADNKKKHTKTFNFFKEKPDFKSCSGWSKVVTKHDLHALHGSEIGVYMVNLTKGSIMGPHWNPAATEVSVVLEGEGMVQVVCPSASTNKECQNSRIRVEEGDVFTVSRFHPMAQTSFNNGSLVFMGFSTSSKKNHPQFLAGKASVLQTLDRFILGVSFNVSNSTVDQLLAAQEGSIILECTSCAEEQEMVMEEAIERERREEERKREEEEARRRGEEERKREEEAARRREEEEEERKGEEEERRKREEEEQRRKEEEEEESRREEEEERGRREEEEQRRKEEEEQRRREEEEERRRRKEEEQRHKEEEEEQRRHEEEEEQRRCEEEEQRRKEEEDEQRRREEEKEQRRQEEEEERRRREEEEEQRRREEEERRQKEEKEKRRREEEEEQKRREEEEQRQKEEKEKRRHGEEEEQRRREEEEQRQIEEEEQKRREEKEERQIEEEKERKREEEEQRQREKEEKQRQREEEEEQKRREEEEEEQRQEEEEEEQKQREEKQRRREKEEEKRREEEEEEQRRQEEEEQHEEDEKGTEERGRGEEESEEEMARREEEERGEWQREEEEARRRGRNDKLRLNKYGRGNQKQKGSGHSKEGRIISRIMSKLTGLNAP